MKTLAILGSTGSIGMNTLDLVRRFPDRFQVAGLAAGENLEELLPQVEQFRPRLVSVRSAALAARLEAALEARGLDAEVCWGDEGLVRVATMPGVEMVVSAVVGAVGLRPTYEALRAGRQMALANKESMVMAGRLLNETARRHGGSILPLDSEHSAIWQSLRGERREFLARLTLTASGGPFFRCCREELAAVSPQAACKHPRWSMGPKISIDSATMMNKALEIIEARWLFMVPPTKITAVIHPQSIVHSLVEFCDGAVLAHLALPDMRLPISCALAYPERLPLTFPVLDLAREGRLEFFPLDPERFPAVELAYRAMDLGDSGTVALNAANEVAVARFVAGKIGFLDITALVAAALDRVSRRDFNSLEEIMAFDRQVRAMMPA